MVTAIDIGDNSMPYNSSMHLNVRSSSGSWDKHIEDPIMSIAIVVPSLFHSNFSPRKYGANIELKIRVKQLVAESRTTVA